MIILLLTTQKDDVKGEVVGQGPSGDPLLYAAHTRSPQEVPSYSGRG